MNQVMDGIIGKSEKERIVFVFMQEVDRFLGEDLGQVGIMITLRFELFISTVSHQRTEGSAVSLGVRRSFLYIFRQQEIVETMGGKTEKLIVPVIQRVGVNVLAVQGFVSKIIFTNLGRLVAVFPEDTCQGGNAFGQSAIKPTLRIPASLVPTGDPSGPGRTADSCRNIGLRVESPSRSKFIEMGSMGVLGAVLVLAQVPIAHVVHLDDQEIGAFFRPCFRMKKQRKEECDSSQCNYNLQRKRI